MRYIAEIFSPKRIESFDSLCYDVSEPGDACMVAIENTELVHEREVIGSHGVPFLPVLGFWDEYGVVRYTREQVKLLDHVAQAYTSDVIGGIDYDNSVICRMNYSDGEFSLVEVPIGVHGNLVISLTNCKIEVGGNRGSVVAIRHRKSVKLCNLYELFQMLAKSGMDVLQYTNIWFLGANAKTMVTLEHTIKADEYFNEVRDGAVH